MFSTTLLWSVVGLSLSVQAINFPYENITLTDADVKNNTSIAFGSLSSATPGPTTSGCKVFPGDKQWPSDSAWALLNTTLGGGLIKGVPPALVCYTGTYNAAQCTEVVDQYNTNGTWRSEDPVTIENEWLDGDSCPAQQYNNVPVVADVPGGNLTTPTCDVSAYPAYVVNVTRVKDVQAAVNFARNAGIRLLIKNTGHDLRGQSAGAGSLSIWTHNLKQFEYLPSFSIGNYTGKAARLASGLQSSEIGAFATASNITIIAPGGPTVGGAGGWFMGGGHGFYTSKVGLGADQVLSLEVVTADGRFITVDPNTNTDLFWAMRGGGGSTWGVVTSLIVKAYDASLLASISAPIIFSTGNTTDGGPIVSNETFWKAMEIYFAYVPTICNAGGVGYNFIYNLDGILKFDLLFLMPGMTLAQANQFANPMYEAFGALGINLTNPNVQTKRSIKSPSLVNLAPTPYPSRGAGMENVRLASRLIPRTSFEDSSSAVFNATIAAFKSAVVEGGYTLHGANHCPSEAVAGYPNDAIVPAYRETAGHMQLWDSGFAIGSPALKAARWTRFQKYFQSWRDVSPGAGSYMGEADPAEPNWQQAFYGAHYPRLLSIKNKWDPWGVFWAKTAVGSEGWEVQTPFPVQVPTQNGKLCKTS
ncbi:FAD-binding domain-containing protein [Stipitochalara longipes BDJ]|nr:FAD-binding domain-containing protein [Stipitochalara longipes BDJ]